MDLPSLVTETAKVLGPTGALASVWLTMWFKNRNGNHSTEEARSATRKVIQEDHDILIEIKTNVENTKADVGEIKGDVKNLMKDSHIHPVP